MNAPSPDDIARLREIAEEGRRAPLLGGSHLILWGSVLALAALADWAMAARVIGSSSQMLALVWFGVLALGWIGSFMIGGKRDASAPVTTTGNKVEKTVWITLGAFMSVLALSLAGYVMLGDAGGAIERVRFFGLVSPVGFGAYAIALNASAVAGDEPRLKPFVIVALALAAATTLLIGRPEQMLVMALGLVLVSIVPGIILRRSEARQG